MQKPYGASFPFSGAGQTNNAAILCGVEHLKSRALCGFFAQVRWNDGRLTSVISFPRAEGKEGQPIAFTVTETEPARSPLIGRL